MGKVEYKRATPHVTLREAPFYEILFQSECLREVGIST